MVYIDCQGLGDLSDTELYEILLSEMLAQLPDVNHPSKVIGGGTGTNYREFVRNIEDFIAPSVERMVLLFDEFEYLARNPRLDTHFFSSLRALNIRYQIAYVLVTVSPLFTLTYGDTAWLGSPFFNIFAQVRLGLFSAHEAHELIARPAEVVGVHFPSKLTEFIHDLTGGHPFMLQVACYWAFEILASRGHFESDYGDLQAMVREDLESYFAYYWGHLSDEERFVLISLSTAESAWPVEQMTHVTAELESKALIVARDSSYSLFSSAFAEFVRTYAGGYSADMGDLYTSLQETQRALDLKPREFVRTASELVERFCQRLDFAILSQSSLPDSRLSLFTLDTRSFFQGIRLPNTLPLLIIQRDRLLESDLDEIRQRVSDRMGTAHRLALLVLLGREPATERARKLLFDKLRQVYAYDVVLLNADDLLKINVAEDPARELRRQILVHTNLATISPFVITGPASDDVFFGREHELHDITEAVTFSSFAVIGGRRIGKSSLLGRLHRTRLPATGFRTAFHDCSTTPTHEAFLTTAIRDWCPEPPSDALTTLSDLLQSPPTDRPLVLLLDEADKLVPADRDTDWQLFSALRALANSGRAQVILSGERILREALRDPASPLFNFANVILLGPLDYRAVEELVTRPMKQLQIELVDERAIVQRIYDFTSGHPSVVQRLCRRLIGRLNEQGTRRIQLGDVDAVIKDPDFIREDFLETYFSRASTLEHLCALLMAADKNLRTLPSVHEALVSRGVVATLNQVDAALERLVDLRSILYRTSEGYDFLVPAFPLIVSKSRRVPDWIALRREVFVQAGDIAPETAPPELQGRLW